MSINDIMSGLKKYISMIIIFTLGILLIVIPINTINTLQSDGLITCFNMSDCDNVIATEILFTPENNTKNKMENSLLEIKEKLKDNNITADVFQEVMFRMNISHENKKTSSAAFIGIGGVTTDQYSYIKGSAPINRNEVAISYIVADEISAEIGDDVQINTGTEVKTYTVTAIIQSMNNMGEGIRFYQDETLDYSKATGCFGVQIKYTDNPDEKTLDKRTDLLKQEYPNSDIYTAGNYITYMIGDVAEQLENVKTLILIIVLCINSLVAVLMVKSFITKEKSEIAILKAIGFKNSSLIKWQTMKIGLVLLISVIFASLISAPLSKLSVDPIFRMMGAYSIKFEINALEVYLIYPLIVLAATTLAAFISAQWLRRIQASEASNID